MTTRFSALPADHGLYRRENEHDACGVAMVATMRGHAGHDIVDHALTALLNLDHRGATGADPLVGDGAGILTQVPDRFLQGCDEHLAILDAVRSGNADAVAAGMARHLENARDAVLDRLDRISAETAP